MNIRCEVELQVIHPEDWVCISNTRVVGTGEVGNFTFEQRDLIKILDEIESIHDRTFQMAST